MIKTEIKLKWTQREAESETKIILLKLNNNDENEIFN